MLRFVLLLGLLGLLGLLACAKREPTPELDKALITVEGAHLRTAAVGEGVHESTATFVLVDARNNGKDGAYVTLDGELLDASGTKVADLLPQVLWLPAGEARTFALVDGAKEPRPTAKSARARVRSTLVLPPPLARIEDIRTFEDNGQLVVQAHLVNEADMDGEVLVTGAFHDERGRPVTRPFYIVNIGAKQNPHFVGECFDRDSPEARARAERKHKGEAIGPIASKCTVQMVGPKGAKRGTIFVGDTMY